MYFCGKSDVGMRRQINQDSFRCISIWGGDAVLLVVCDGMGGHKAGEIASKNAVEVFCSKIIASNLSVIRSSVPPPKPIR